MGAYINLVRPRIITHKKNGPEGPYLLNTEVFTSWKLNYFNKANTDWPDWFACANIAVAACEMICDLASLVVSVA